MDQPLPTFAASGPDLDAVRVRRLLRTTARDWCIAAPDVPSASTGERMKIDPLAGARFANRRAEQRVASRPH